MATNGLSLVGFMTQAEAIEHLKRVCVPPDITDAALTQAWQQAVAQLGQPVQGAGNPQIQALDAVQTASLTKHKALTDALASYPGSSFQFVEIGPLLAYQTHVDEERAAHHCKHLNANSSFDEIATVCLPSSIVMDEVQQLTQQQSAIIKSRSLNMRMGVRGIFRDANGPNAMGFNVFLALPLVHVTRFNGRCYLHNGYHRALGLLRAGITRMACLFREALTADTAGIATPPATFPLTLLESPNPPTLIHFGRGSAWAVKLRAACRILHVSWSDYIMFDE